MELAAKDKTVERFVVWGLWFVVCGLWFGVWGLWFGVPNSVQSLTKKLSSLSSAQTNAAYQMKLMQKNLEQLKTAARKSGVTVEKA